MGRHVYKSRALWTLAALVSVLTIAGCADYNTLAAAVRPAVTKTFTVETSSVDKAFGDAFLAVKDIRVNVSREDRSKGHIFGSRGSGYTELTYVEILVKPNMTGGVMLTIQAKSSDGGEGIINEFIAAYGRYGRIA